ncbi:hypothetical protein [Kluyvera sichuanensis]|uniref:hypothetical protein n=1 Tax=Kluyvera sichuanensis TaxID=2725494 RepID=UPI0034A2C9DE
MGQKIITLSGAATDVLYALFFRGALQSGDLPAKSGAAELRELGFAETRHTATEYQKENYFTFLTAEGQEFAIKHLVNTRFGMPVGGYLGETSSNEGDSRKIVFKAGLFTPVNVTTIPVLTDEMKQAVIDAVRESDLFTSLQAAIAAQAASTVNLQQAVNDAVGDAIRNSLAPGGPIWNSLKR